MTVRVFLLKPENDNCAQIWETQTGNCLATLGECTDAYYNGACNVIITSIVCGIAS